MHVEFHAIQYGSVDKNVFIPFNWTYRGTDYYVCFIKKEQEIKKTKIYVRAVLLKKQIAYFTYNSCCVIKAKSELIVMPHSHQLNMLN